MIRAPILYLAYLFYTVGFSVANIEDLTTIPECEDKSPHEIYFNLSNMGLNVVRKSFASGPSVTCVNLAGNRISKLELGAFDGLPELTYLNLAGNPVSLLDFMQMDFPKLRTLVLDGHFSERTDAHNPLSWYYSDREQRLSKISPITLPNLEKLSLRNFENEELTIWLDYFNVPNLTHLYLDGNTFTDGNVLENFKSTLIHLNMNNNQVQMFMTNLPQLRYLSLNGNKIQKLCNSYCDGYSLSLRDLPNLEYLSLQGNMISTIELDAFENSAKLHVLNLAGNKMEHLPRHLFDNMANLKNLILSNNELTEIPEICGLRDLEVLDLRGNKILSIDHESFCNLGHLNFIDLSHNGLKSVANGTFEELPALATLDLSWNQIEALPENWMGFGPVTLNTLGLDGNLFNDVANMSLGLFVGLDKLSIGYNPLKTITIKSLMTLPQDMKIDVSRVLPPLPQHTGEYYL